MAIARDLRGENHDVVAVIGDGALTGGMAFEALNHAGHLGTHMIIVLNDNEMSIASNVGALSSYLSRIRSDPRYYKGKEDIEQILKAAAIHWTPGSENSRKNKRQFKVLSSAGDAF